MQDDDGYIRQAIAWANVGSEKIYSLAYATYAAYMEKMGEDCYQPKVYANHEFEFDYSGRSGEYENVSLCDVLNGTIDPRVFKDCIVFVGAYAPGMQDSFHVAVQRKTQMYGVEIHANIVDALLKEKTAVPVNKWLLAVLMALVAGLCSRFIWKSKIWAAGHSDNRDYGGGICCGNAAVSKRICDAPYLSASYSECSLCILCGIRLSGGGEKALGDYACI